MKQFRLRPLSLVAALVRSKWCTRVAAVFDRDLIVAFSRTSTGSVSIRDGTIYEIGSTITPSGPVHGGKNRDRCLTLPKRVELDWNQYRGWYSLAVTL